MGCLNSHLLDNRGPQINVQVGLLPINDKRAGPNNCAEGRNSKN